MQFSSAGNAVYKCLEGLKYKKNSGAAPQNPAWGAHSALRPPAAFLGRYATSEIVLEKEQNLGEEKMTTTVFYANLNMILMKRK